MCTIIVMVCLLKSLCIPSFDSYVSELHAHIIMYGLRLFVVIHCLPHDVAMVVMEFYQFRFVTQ